MKITSLILVFILVIFTGCSNRTEDSRPETELKTTVANSSSETTTTTTATTTTTTTTVKVDNEKVTTSASTTAASTTKVTTKKEEKISKKVLPVENIQQLPELPGGCEITSTTIVLNYYGLKCDKVELAEKYLPTVQYPDENGYWVTPWEAFVGSPQQGYYGCYSPVISKTINNFFEANNIVGYQVVDLSESDFKELFREIDQGNPVIIWASQDMVDINMDEVSWQIKNGETFKWTRYEHCLVLIGYDLEKDTVFLSDPLDPRGTVEYPRETVERVYAQVYKQALVIHKNYN